MRKHGDQIPDVVSQLFSRVQRPVVIVAAAVMLYAANADAQGGLQWVAASNGVVPQGAIAYGREADGRPQYPCRAALGGGRHLGELTPPATGCSVGYRGRAISVPSYEVLVQPPPSRTIAETARPVMRGGRAAILLQPPTGPATVPPTPPDASTKRGFDDHGQPYVEVRLPDGTVKRTQASGVTLFKPDGTSQFIPNMSVRSNALPPTPPVLPSDPQEGRVWVERHNAALLDLISSMVGRDDGEMKKFSDAEQQAAGDDLFKQIMYRTNVASFLATSR